jgi:PKD repeat protein
MLRLMLRLRRGGWLRGCAGAGRAYIGRDSHTSYLARRHAMLRRAPSTAAAVLLLAVLGACSDVPEPLDFDTPVQMSAQARQDLIAVQNRYTPELMQREGIIGTGLRPAGAGTIVVYAVSPSHAAAARVPRQLEGYDVEVVVTGRIDATDYNNPTTKERPAPNGFSVGHPDITAGTIGARVKDGAGNAYILSNNHVIANSNNANIGDPTLQPGPYDGGTSADQIGTLADFEVIVMGGASNTMDAAIALVPNGANLLGATPDYAYGAPGTSPVNASVNMSVQKFGRTTGHTTGTVAEVNVTVSVCYVPRGFFMCAEAATFTNQFTITPGSFSAGGDSGSLIVTDNGSKNPVGLLFAGSSTRTIANPIAPVLTRFGVEIDPTNDGGDPPDDPPDDPPGDDTTAPTASFSYSCSRANCSFTDQSTDNVGVTAWSWSFGDGGTSTQRNPTHTFTTAGSKTVTLTVQDAAGNTSAPFEQTLSCVMRGPNLHCS